MTVQTWSPGYLDCVNVAPVVDFCCKPKKKKKKKKKSYAEFLEAVPLQRHGHFSTLQHLFSHHHPSACVHVLQGVLCAQGRWASVCVCVLDRAGVEMWNVVSI